ncbi:hypothetical protein CGCSCA5_v008210 [Colletotrichum siamense]|nr:hypothetical protein CGCSCA5_v008210 [Colletotrichum siamense]
MDDAFIGIHFLPPTRPLTTFPDGGPLRSVAGSHILAFRRQLDGIDENLESWNAVQHVISTPVNGDAGVAHQAVFVVAAALQSSKKLDKKWLASTLRIELSRPDPSLQTWRSYILAFRQPTAAAPLA